MQRILLHHGWNNLRPEGHWLRQTANELRSKGNAVWYPQFPNPGEPNADEWQALVTAESSQMDEVGALVPGGEKIAVCHSLGCINWLVAARAGKFAKRFDRVVFVAPPDPQMLEPIGGAPLDLADAEWLAAINQNASNFLLVASDRDKWQPRGLHEAYLKHWPDVSTFVIEGAGHFSLDDGWGSWQGLTEWLITRQPNNDLLTKR